MEMQPAARREFSYGELLGDSFSILWRNKYLWVLALLPALVGVIFSILTSFGGLVSQGTAPGQAPAFLQGGNVGILIGVGVVLFLISIVLYVFFAVVTAGAMTGAVSEVERGRGSSFGAAWRIGMSKFWKVFLQAILAFLIAAGLLLAVSIVCGIPVLLTFLLSQSVGLRVAMSVIFGLLYFVLLLAVFIPWSVVYQYALRNLVADDGGVVSSISSGYRIFRGNIGRSLLVWLINFGLTLAVGIVSAIISFVINIAIVGASFGIASTGAQGAASVTTVVAQIVALVPSTAISVLTITFFSVYWTISYLRIAETPNRNIETPGEYGTPGSPESSEPGR